MSTVLAALIGYAVGFVAAIGLGPLNLAVVTGALQGRRRGSLALAAGGSLGDFLYGSVIMLGFAGALAAWFDRGPLRIICGFGVVAIGLFTLLFPARPMSFEQGRLGRIANRRPAPPSGQGAGADAGPQVHGAFWIGFLISAFNPWLVLSWFALAGAVHGAGWIGTGAAQNISFAAGASLGMVSWLALLLYLVSRFRERVSPRGLVVLVRSFGVLMTLLGVWLAVG